MEDVIYCIKTTGVFVVKRIKLVNKLSCYHSLKPVQERETISVVSFKALGRFAMVHRGCKELVVELLKET